MSEIPYGPGGLHADDRQDRGEGHPERPFATEQDAVGTEPGVAGQGPASEELEKIGGESTDKAREQRRVALEDVLIDGTGEQQRGDDQDDREDHCRASPRG